MRLTFNTLLARSALVVGLIAAADGHAALVSTLGGQAYYDPASNLTWIADANLAASNSFGVSGISGGLMSFATATHWIAAMNAADYLGYSDWRLPTTAPIDGASFVVPGAPNYETYDGSSDVGYSIGAPGTAHAGSVASEMAYLFYNALGDTAYYDVSGKVQLTTWLQNSNGPFVNNDGWTYWSSTTSPGNYAWNFDTDLGAQNLGRQTYAYRAWAVRSGYAAAVPEPRSSLLMTSGLLLLASIAAQRRKARCRSAAT